MGWHLQNLVIKNSVLLVSRVLKSSDSARHGCFETLWNITRRGSAKILHAWNISRAEPLFAVIKHNCNFTLCGTTLWGKKKTRAQFTRSPSAWTFSKKSVWENNSQRHILHSQWIVLIMTYLWLLLTTFIVAIILGCLDSYSVVEFTNLDKARSFCDISFVLLNLTTNVMNSQSSGDLHYHSNFRQLSVMLWHAQNRSPTLFWAENWTWLKALMTRGWAANFFNISCWQLIQNFA